MSTLSPGGSGRVTSAQLLRLAAALALILSCGGAAAQSPRLGRPATSEEIAAFAIDIAPDGGGLPHGTGTPKEGEAIFNAKFAACHGEKGAGKPHDALVGGQGTLAGVGPAVKTVGSYWPYATTIFDYVRRAMPLNAPKSLADDEVYAVVAYLLRLNGVIAEDAVIDATSLPEIKMPNREGFRPFARGD